MSNGSRHGGDTEDGAYAIVGGRPDAGTVGSRKGGAQYFIPDQNEWYKAAYAQGTPYDEWASKLLQVPVVAPVNANGDCTNGWCSNYSRSAGCLTTVGTTGAYPGGPSGGIVVYDASGNVSEWTESQRFFGGRWEQVRLGGSVDSPSVYKWDTRDSSLPESPRADTGFRIGRK